MFTGIVQSLGTVTNIRTIEHSTYGLTISVPPEQTINLQLGASVAIDGVCLTVTDFSDTSMSFDIIEPTREKTTLNQRTIGQKINVERSLKFGDELGGHLVSGHVHCTGKITHHTESNLEKILWITLPIGMIQNILPQGFVAVDGVSVTVVTVDSENSVFTISLIPETRMRTTLGFKKTNDLVNIEFDQLIRQQFLNVR